MRKHNLIKKLSIGIASLALLCPLALGELNTANADSTNHNQSSQYINKTSNNNQSNKEANASTTKTVATNKNENKLAQTNQNNNLRLGASHKRKSVRHNHKAQLKTSTKKRMNHKQRKLKNLKKHHKNLYSKLKNKKHNNKKINKRNHMRSHAKNAKKHVKKHVKRNTKRHMKRTNLKKHNHKRHTYKKHVNKKRARKAHKHSTHKNHKASITNSESSDNSNNASASLAPTAPESDNTNTSTSSDIGNFSTTSNASNSVAPASTSDNHATVAPKSDNSNSQSNNNSNNADYITDGTLKVYKNGTGYRNWYSHPEISDPIVNRLHINKFDAAYCDDHKNINPDNNDGTPFPRKKYFFYDDGAPVNYYMASHAELENDRDPFRDWTPEQFTKAVPTMLDIWNNTPLVLDVAPDIAIMEEFTHADPNVQQANKLADETWND